MEQNQKITLETSKSYDIPLEELKRMYVSLALSKYSYLRKPNYDENRLLKLLKTDFNKFTTQIQTLIEQIPDNHSLYKLLVFFDNHNKLLKQVVEQESEID